MIQIQPSKTADTRSCDFSRVSRETLLASSRQHIGDVSKALGFFSGLLLEAAARHDFDKLSDIDGFHADFVTGFAQTGWWDRHRQLNRHHLLAEDGVPEDVNLIDVLDMVADCVMAGMARTGSVYPLGITDDVLRRAFDNTVALLTSQVVVEKAVVGPNQKPLPHPFYGDSWERGVDPWHADAFKGTPGEGVVGNVGERKGGWFLLDGHGTEIGFVPDGTPLEAPRDARPAPSTVEP